MNPSPRFVDHLKHSEVLREAALQAVDPGMAVRRNLSPADFHGARKVHVVGAGKAGVAMAQAVADILGNRVTSGVIAVPSLPKCTLDKIRFIQGGHPTPTEGSLSAGHAIADLLAHTETCDLVVALISGGGSALLELPCEGISLDDLQATNTALLRSGAAIHEINTVRRQLSRVKGGGLARLADPARVLGLILSDVVGNSLEIIGSGPTVLSTVTRHHALAVIDKYRLCSELPSPVLKHLARGKNQASKDAWLLRVENRLIASNRQAGEAAVAAARKLGFDAVFVADDWQGEAREVGKKLAELAMLSGPGMCLVAGGESTVAVRGSGRGGRNQEAALAAALAIEGRPKTVIATLATDGIDGPTDAAGALVTGETIPRARALGLDATKYIAENDSYSFFKALGDLIITGPTGTNVNDLMFAFIY